MRTRYKQWAVDYLDLHPELVIKDFSFNDPFFQGSIYYEIGSGKGEFLTDYSLKHPNNHFLAVERARTIAGMMAKRLVDNECSNVRLFPLDGQELFEKTPDNSLDGIFLNFVDPWPKKRHEKRRLTYHTFLEQYYRMLKFGGKIFFKSDNDALYEWTLEEIKNTPFKIEINEPDYQFDEANDSLTGYEQKFRGIGHPIHRIVLIKE